MDEEAYSGPERRTRQPLSDEQIEHIAQKAAELAVQRMAHEVYASVGETVIKKVLWIVGVVATAMVLGNASIKELLK